MEGANKAQGVLGREIHPGEAMAKRDPSWDECGIEQRINRLRESLLVLCSQAQMSGGQAHEAVKIAKAHQHGGRGEVVLPVIEQLGGLVEQAYGAHPFEHVRRMLR